MGKDVAEISEDALKSLLDYDWPGNVRELENAIERAIVTSKTKVLTCEDFAFLSRSTPAMQNWTAPQNLTLQEVEKEVILATLQRAQGNIKKAAGLLGIDRSTLYDKLRKYKAQIAGETEKG